MPTRLAPHDGMPPTLPVSKHKDQRVFRIIKVLHVVCGLLASTLPAIADDDFHLIPYPQEITRTGGNLELGPAEYVVVKVAESSEVIQVAKRSLSSYLPRSGRRMTVRLGCVEEGYDRSWLTHGENQFLADPSTSDEASILEIAADGITVVGKGKWGMLYGVQTVNQLIRGTDARHGVWQMKTSLPCLVVEDWPDMRWRCLSPTMTWYSGYNRLEGYDLCNWTLDEWKWLVEWSLLHKCNAWAMCLYGNWPFTLPGYAETTLDVASFYYDPKTGQKTPHRFVHKNIKREFLPELIRYANQRGVKIYAYIGKNTFNGTYGLKHPDANAGGAAELIPFHPGVEEYWDAFIRRLLEIGFNGFVFENPEALHVPNQNQQCYETFWTPWAETYGFKSVAETDQNHPPLGVHVEYYAWLFKTFDGMIQRHAREFGRPTPEIYLISHILLSRIVGESATQAERDKWFAYVDQKQGRKVPFVILEAEESKYVSFLGRDRVASLGGRGGSCTCAMFRIASINNNWCGGGMGGDLAYERACQKHIYQAGGFGAMGYIFEWTNTEVFGYLAAQYLWRNSGVPGINNDDQTGFLYYAYPSYYGDKVGAMAARILDEGSDVNDQMMLEGVFGAQYPSTGAPLHRDYQLLGPLADRAVRMAREAYKTYTGHEPDLWHPAYRQEDFRWNGFNPAADKLFKSERLRLLFVSTNRSAKICEAVLAHRMAQRRMAERATAGEVLKYFDRAVEAARENQRIYCINYDDDYDWTDGLCSRVADELELRRRKFIASLGPADMDLKKLVPDRVRKSAEKPLMIAWEKLTDIVPASPLAEKARPVSEHRPRIRSKSRFLPPRSGFHGAGSSVRRHLANCVPPRGRKANDGLGALGYTVGEPQGRRQATFHDGFLLACPRPQRTTWKWAIWGRPQLIGVAADGRRRVRYDFIEHVDQSKTLVRLDADGRERSEFDGRGKDSTGATFQSLSPGVLQLLMAGEGKDWQMVDGFADWITPPPHKGPYRCYLGNVESGWSYGGREGELAWRTAPIPAKKTTAVAFVAGTGYAPGKGRLWCNGEHLLSFDMAKPVSQTWENNGVQLRLLFGGDTRNETTTFGMSGIYVLLLPASKVTPGKPLELAVKLPSGAGDWFMVHEYQNVAEASQEVLCPKPEEPAIAAFTPHSNGRFGVTIGECQIKNATR